MNHFASGISTRPRTHLKNETGTHKTKNHGFEITSKNRITRSTFELELTPWVQQQNEESDTVNRELKREGNRELTGFRSWHSGKTGITLLLGMLPILLTRSLDVVVFLARCLEWDVMDAETLLCACDTEYYEPDVEDQAWWRGLRTCVELELDELGEEWARDSAENLRLCRAMNWMQRIEQNMRLLDLVKNEIAPRDWAW